MRLPLPLSLERGVNYRVAVLKVGRQAWVAAMSQAELGLVDVEVVQFVGLVDQLPYLLVAELNADVPVGLRRNGMLERFWRDSMRLGATIAIHRRAVWVQHLATQHEQSAVLVEGPTRRSSSKAPKTEWIWEVTALCASCGTEQARPAAP